MAIRFPCIRCNQLLGAANRKAGAEIECPRCGMFQVVPSKEKAAAAMAVQQARGVGASGEEYENVIILDEPEIEQDVLPPPASPQGVPSLGPGPATVAPRRPEVPVAVPVPPSPEPVEGPVVPQDMILLSRRTLFVQGALYFVVALGAFWVGLAVHPENPGPETARSEAENGQQALPMPIEGRILYDPGDGRFVGDGGAVILALPAGRHPDNPLPADSLGPQDRLSTTGQRTVGAIEQLGGAYTRADREGRFFTTVPREGTYRLLLISASASRPVRETAIDPVDEMEIERYFDQAERLIGRSKYRLTVEQVNPALGKIEYAFGKTAEE